MIRFALLVAASLALLACPKKVPSNVAGTDDEQVDQLSAQLEELRAKSQAGELKCSDWCDLASRARELSGQTCEIAKRHGDRSDFQTKCVTSQEDFARFNESCSGCKK